MKRTCTPNASNHTCSRVGKGKGVGGDDLFAPNYRCHFPGNVVLDKKEHDHITITFFAAFPDGRFTVEDTAT